MSKPDALYKTTIVLWTKYEPGFADIARLAQEADGLCEKSETVKEIDVSRFPDFFLENQDQENETPGPSGS